MSIPYSLYASSYFRLRANLKRKECFFFPLYRKETETSTHQRMFLDPKTDKTLGKNFPNLKRDREMRRVR